MPMTRTMKSDQVDQIEALFSEQNSYFLVDLTGLGSNEINDLRALLRKEGARMRVVKNRLALRAIREHAAEGLSQWFRGPTAVVYHPDEPVTTAKKLIDFAKDHPALEIKAGLIDRRDTVDGEGVKAVSELPTIDGARAMLLSLFLSPMTQLVRLLATPGTQVARAIEERSKQS